MRPPSSLLDRPSAAASRHPFTAWPGRSLLWICCRAARGTWFLVLIHIGALGCFLADTTLLHWLLLPALLAIRGLITTVGYHRYFAHRSFKTSRPVQFVLGCLCCLNLQRGPLYWAAIHRHHHRHSDGPHDSHSPVQGSFLWAYGGWMFASIEEPDWARVRDLTRFPELV